MNGDTVKGDILIVDDTPANLRLLAGMLSEQEYRVRPVQDGESALKAVQASSTDLILLDINMPGMNGYEVAQKLAGDPSTADIPIIFISALDEVLDKVKAFDSGGVDYITKPFQFEEVLARVETHLTLRRLRIQLEQANDVLESRVQERTVELLQLNQSLDRFVPHVLLDFLNKESIVDVSLGDHVQGDMAVMFADIRGFTALSENLTPEESFSLLNDYLGIVGPIIRENNGFVDKYLGDGLMAVFPESPVDAVQASIAMQNALSKYNQKLQANDLAAIRVGVGINTGKVTLGMLGEEQRIQGTVISDAVNVASRLEGLTKQYDISIAICQGTVQAVQKSGDYNFRFIDRVRAKGRMGTMNVFEIFDSDPPVKLKNKQQTKPDFERGLDYYYQRQFAEAGVEFNKVLKDNPGDNVAQIYMKRAGRNMAEGVPDDWTGVELLQVK
ncbi:MAG: response regulator [Anaerolineales bacterium]|nr:response regulator [Chloroflexota bacterium]MBL6981075.1 response regulator [Anaerolineales bacterium]